MTKQIKSKFELFNYLMYAYRFELENVETKNGVQKRLENLELEEYLKKTTKELIKVNDLIVELKLGPHYNRSICPWVMIFNTPNRSGNKRKIRWNIIRQRYK